MLIIKRIKKYVYLLQLLSSFSYAFLPEITKKRRQSADVSDFLFNYIVRKQQFSSTPSPNRKPTTVSAYIEFTIKPIAAKIAPPTI